MTARELGPAERERLETWYRSLSGRRGKELHAAIGHDLTPGRAPRLGKVLVWTALVGAVVGAVLLGLAGGSRGAVVLLLPFVGLAALGSFLILGIDAGFALTDELLVALWEADQRLSPPDR